MLTRNHEPNKFTCGVQIALSAIGGRWRLVILYFLMKHGAMRFGEIKKCIPLISKKMLASQLRELEREGIICRKENKSNTAYAEYAMTDYGLSLKDLVFSLREWGDKHAQRNEKA